MTYLSLEYFLGGLRRVLLLLVGRGGGGLGLHELVQGVEGGQVGVAADVTLVDADHFLGVGVGGAGGLDAEETGELVVLPPSVEESPVVPGVEVGGDVEVRGDLLTVVDVLALILGHQATL